MQPAESVINKFGGQCALARLVGRRQSTVQHWAKAGRIPAKWQPRLLQLAREHGINLSTSELVGDSKHAHLVHFYDDDSFLAEQVARFVAAAMGKGNAAVVIATEQHRTAIGARLTQRGFDVADTERRGTYLAIDAAATLQKFMVGGQPDRARFVATVRPLIENANRNAGREDAQAAAFGEMVALLWRDGNQRAAIELERMWNDLSQLCKFSLLCGYPMKCFGRKRDAQNFLEVCEQHVDVIPAESYSALPGGTERNRTIARLQQRAQAIEAEFRRGEEQLDLVESVAGVARMEVDLDDDSVALSAGAQRMFGIGSNLVSLQHLLSSFKYSGDRNAFELAINRARTGRKQFEMEFRIARDSVVSVVNLHGRTFFNGGSPVLIGVLREMSASA